MAQFMPEGMRKLGLAMHQSASDFGTEAPKAAKTGDGRPASAALPRPDATVRRLPFRLQGAIATP